MIRRTSIYIGILLLGIGFQAMPALGQENVIMSNGNKSVKKAIFAGGCFWCMQSPYDVLEGVISTSVGYIGGMTENPTYDEVSTGQTGHAEAVEVVYDASKVTYEKLIEVFWRNIDPTTKNQQFADTGSQYRTAIFYEDDNQKKIAEESKEQLQKSGRYSKPIVTEIVPAGLFYPAEDYHQKYYKKNSNHYKLYRAGSGREGYLNRMWPEASHESKEK